MGILHVHRPGKQKELIDCVVVCVIQGEFQMLR